MVDWGLDLKELEPSRGIDHFEEVREYVYEDLEDDITSGLIGGENGQST